MKIEIINKINSYLPVYVIDKSLIIKSNEATDIEIKTYEYDFINNKFSSLQKENHTDDEYIQNGEYMQNEKYFEGSQKLILVNAYERDLKVRNECIKKYGTLCSVCEIDLEKVYGKRGKGFIEVHHIVPLYRIKTKYIVSSNDLRPICPNCHSMIHRFNDEMNIDQLRKIIKDNKI